ncbi:MAG: 4-vinyl reductase [Reichenbachiella sp.]
MSTFGSYLKDKNVYEFCNEPLFYQSEYFGIHVLKGLEELGEGLDLKNILSTSAHEIAYAQFIGLFTEKDRYDIDERKKVVADYFASCGFGLLDLKSIQAKGGHIDIRNEHSGKAWEKHFSLRKEGESGVGYFALGFLCGVVEAIFGSRPGTFDGKQLKCIAKGDEFSRFEIFRGFKRNINRSAGLGRAPINTPENSGEDSSYSLVESFSKLETDNANIERGELNWFDTSFTKHYVNYFALVEIKLLMQANKKLGPSGLKQVKKLLTDVSEKSAYFTFGKILNSAFWQEELSSNEKIRTSGGLENCLNLLTALGYGKWESVPTDIANQYKVVISNCPRTNAFLKLVGNTKSPIGFVNGSTLVGIANLIEKGIASIEAVDTEFVNNLAESNQFEFVEETSRMTGNDNDTFIVSQT